jgi:hypothetical protein
MFSAKFPTPRCLFLPAKARAAAEPAGRKLLNPPRHAQSRLPDPRQPSPAPRANAGEPPHARYAGLRPPPGEGLGCRPLLPLRDAGGPDRLVVAERHRGASPVGRGLGQLHGGAEVTQEPDRRVAVDRPAVDLGLRDLLRDVGAILGQCGLKALLLTVSSGLGSPEMPPWVRAANEPPTSPSEVFYRGLIAWTDRPTDVRLWDQATRAAAE